MKPATVPTPVDELAVMVWEQLAEAGERGLSLWELQKYHLPDLSKPQIKRGIDRISHVLQESREQPLVFFAERGRGNVWKFPRHSMDYRTFALRKMRELITRNHTEMTRAEAAVLRWPEHLPPYLPKMMRRSIEDLEDILLELSRTEETE